MKHTKILTVALLAVFALTLPIVGLAQGQSLLHRKEKPELLEDAEVEVEGLRAKGKEKSTEARVAACEKRQTALHTKTDRYQDNAGKYLGVVDKIFDRVQSFYDNEKLTAPNYDELVATATLAKSEAGASIDTLGEFEEVVDCEDPDVAKDVSAFRGGASQTRELLHAYSTSVKNVISAMQSVNSNANQNGDSTESTDTTDVSLPSLEEEE